MLISLRTTGFAALALALAVSCTKSPSGKVYTRNNLPMTFQQVVPVPATASNGSGSIDASYDQNTRLLTYTVRWSSTDSATAIHVHGLGEAGYAAPLIQNASGVPRRTSSSYTSTLLIDGVVLKEDELLSGRYYIDLHTKSYSNAAAGGELRGQLNFNL
ncbi:MAG: CHRD domain-containing protein [Chitinophagaceae bacterium]|nr:MAG: CHRD domain-containing protein [Chitinophagaceae bacterium]